MALHKNFLMRLRYIDELLSNTTLTIAELTDRVNDRLVKEHGLEYKVSQRTIEKDLYYLDNDSPWCYDAVNDAESPDEESLIKRSWRVEENPNLKGKTISHRLVSYREKGFSVFNPKISEQEKQLLSAALSFIGKFDGLPEFGGIDMLQKRFSVDSSSKEISLSSVNALISRDTLGKLYDAIIHKRVVNVHYHHLASVDQATVYTLHPYHLREYNGRWYVIGALETDDYRIFNMPLDRIEEVSEAKGRAFHEAYGFNPSSWYSDVIGVTVYRQSPVYDVLFWVCERSSHYVLSKPLHHSQALIEDSDSLRQKYPQCVGGKFFSIKVKSNYELIRELTSFGDELLVLSPSEIVEQVKRRIAGMYAAYFK